MSSYLDIIWVLVCSVLVFLMQAGFAMLEAGLTRAKNAGNIIMKNIMDYCVGSLVFWAIGFGIMYGRSAGGIVGIPQLFGSSSYEKALSEPLMIQQSLVPPIIRRTEDCERLWLLQIRQNLR